MQKILFSKKLNKADHLKILKVLLIFSNSIAILLYAFLRILFYNTPITATDDITAVCETFVIGSLSASALYTLLVFVEIAGQLLTQKKSNLYPALKYAYAALFIMLLFYPAACKPQLAAGIMKDGNVGMITIDKVIEPAKTLLVMNNEILNHIDISPGNQYSLINDDVKRLMEKNGKIYAGCGLVITN